MIPELNQSGVLPPFIPEYGPTDSAGMAPYQTTILEFVQRYSQSNERVEILKGLLAYREQLRNIGVTDGFHWIDGSFVENIEENQGRPPSDIDLVTFAFRPAENHDQAKWKAFVNQNKEIFTPELSKDKFICDAYYVDLSIHPVHIVNSTKYWFGLFSHQRDSYLWKGMVEIPILCNDDEAKVFIEQGVNNA